MQLALASGIDAIGMARLARLGQGCGMASGMAMRMVTLATYVSPPVSNTVTCNLLILLIVEHISHTCPHVH